MRMGLAATAIAMAAGFVLAGTGLRAQKADLASVLQQMDASAGKFQDVTANVKVDNYTAVVQDHEYQQGTTAFRRASGGMEMVTHLKTLDGKAYADLLYRNGELDYYNPVQKQETIIAAGANKQEYDSFLATGFGATGKELSAAWTVTLMGMESIDGVQTAKLDLVSKDARVRENFSHVQVWLDASRDISLKQVMVQPSGDSRTVTYSNVEYNTPVKSDLFKLDIPKGTPVQRR
ncbi:MAG TPA: sigma-E factor regulatory protein RseB domain-containing protein [Acidobacteriaceae bacterium]|jgi:outer membrane lipoprotein-sorting protein|nr:sigma-E factor regulatory protein RseB domain-containing protein [Acidobacteriaceae bacterium]